ncbi:MAG: formylglycine-generating enzyme family protein [Nibricoccus sp.]
MKRSFVAFFTLFVAVVANSTLSFGQPTAALSKTLTLDLGDGVTMDLVLIPAGSFIMGSDENTGDGDEFPEHTVVLSKPFYLGKYEVTQEQWVRVMGANPSQFKGANLPVETVNWHDCQKFLTRLGEQTGTRASLPTEAQWEYACRAGTTTKWFHGESDKTCADYAWSGENAANSTHPVGTKKPNAWGLYDMTGNVWEWCSDHYQKHAYAAGRITDPTGPTKGESYVTRGGAWGDNTELLRPAARNCVGPDVANQGLGFRCVILTP